MNAIVRAQPVAEPVVKARRPDRWRSVALAAVCIVAAVLYGWRIGTSGWGNPYYSAAVKSMSASLTNFMFGSFDSLGVVTVDKPPMALWPMVASAAVFGYHGWSLLLPQVLEGVAAVLLLHRTIRRWAGEHVALLAALIFALTPVTVAIDRDTNPDTLMVLLLVAAAYSFTRSVQPLVDRGTSSRWLMLAAMFLGFGFVTKMLQAWIVVPVFAVAYLVGSAAPVRRRVLDLLGAGAVLLASSLWWVALVSFWPGPKPYVGGSTDGSVLNLVIGYNGLGRILGRETGRALVGGSSAPGGPTGGHWTGGHGGGGGFGVTIAGIRQIRAGQPTDRIRRAGWVLWGGWLLLVGVVLSAAQSGFHPYYTTEMAPAVAAVSAAGLAALWRYYRRPDGYHWMLFPAAVVLTAAWAWVQVSQDISWHGWLRYAVVAAGAIAVLLLVAGRLALASTNLVLSRVAGALGVVAVLLAPGVWSAATALAPSGGAMAQAGPQGHSRGPVPARAQGAMDGELTVQQATMLAYAQAHSGGSRITLAVEGGARAAEPYLIHSDATIIGMGGFSGQDPAPTAATLAGWVQQHQLRYVLLGSPDLGGRRGDDHAPSRLASRGGVSAQRTQWVRQHCTALNVGGAQDLYDCQAG
ncbi:MAG: ArnT family glycosyltransferase [Pseudonocardiaceae bacterium]